MQNVDVAIIGAGPYGLSLSAYLSACKVEHRIFGEPMEAWRKGMPPGMALKSDGWSSSLYNPEPHFTLAEFCQSAQLPYHDSQSPVPIETFISYGLAFQKRLVPQVERKRLTGLSHSQNRFELRFDDGTSVTANKVVLAVGIHSFKSVPKPLADLPRDHVSHSGDHGPLAPLKGKHVTIVGSGASATDLAVLLHEQGNDVLLVARAKELHFGTRSGLHRSRLQKLRSPSSGIGGGWTLKICADAPELIHALPSQIRLHLVKTKLGPSGGWFMAHRVLGHVPLALGCEIDGVRASGGKVQLNLRASGGKAKNVATDHIIAATGYRTDMRRLGFLDPGILQGMRLLETSPALSGNYETSVPGLHVIGFASAYSFGPVARFVYGAVYPARQIAKHFAPSVSKQARVMRSVEAN